MFKFEFLSLLKELKEADEEEKKKILSSLKKLIQEHEDEYQDLQEKGLVPDEIVEQLSQTEDKPQESKNEDEISRINQAYKSWLNDYNPNNPATQNMKKIVEDLVKFYAPNRFGVLQRLLDMQDSKEFEIFKLHLKNKLRAYYSQQIINYTNSPNYENLTFFKKLRKKKELRKLLNSINKYQFEPQKINEALQ